MRWIRSVKPDWRWSGLLTRAQVVRNHPDPPAPSWTSAPSGYGSGFLIRRRKVTVGSSPTWSSNPKHFPRFCGIPKVQFPRARGGIGRRAVLRRRWETVRVRPSPSAPTAPLRIWMRRPHCRCGEGGSIPLRGAIPAFRFSASSLLGPGQAVSRKWLSASGATRISECGLPDQSTAFGRSFKSCHSDQAVPSPRGLRPAAHNGLIAGSNPAGATNNANARR
jgi:hypothetical protein